MASRRLACLAASVLLAPSALAQADALPSWNDGAARKAIVQFVSDVTKAGSPAFVAPAERIAVFDNDGTLWVEQPMYTQLAFALDRVKALAAEHPEWKTQEPFKSVLAGDLKSALAGGEHAIAELVMAKRLEATEEDIVHAMHPHPTYSEAIMEAAGQALGESVHI